VGVRGVKLRTVRLGTRRLVQLRDLAAFIDAIASERAPVLRNSSRSAMRARERRAALAQKLAAEVFK
jgi:hypothetical protein